MVAPLQKGANVVNCVDMYKNLVTIADDDAETVDDLLSFHADDLEVIENDL